MGKVDNRDIYEKREWLNDDLQNRTVLAQNMSGFTIEPLTVTENGTYTAPVGKAYTPVTVNVAGGGGSSDFSTAEVTLINHSESYDKALTDTVIIDGNYLITSASFPDPEYDSTWEVVLYKGRGTAVLNSQGVQVNVTGDAHVSSSGALSTTVAINGDCSIEITV